MSTSFEIQAHTLMGKTVFITIITKSYQCDKTDFYRSNTLTAKLGMIDEIAREASQQGKYQGVYQTNDKTEQGGMKRMEPRKILSTEQFKESIGQGVTLVDFNAPWCMPCKAQEPIMEALTKQYEGKATIAEINVDNNQETAMNLGIRSIPTLTLFKNGKEIKRFIGVQSQEKLSSAIDEIIE